jgi:hypothetical protein
MATLVQSKQTSTSGIPASILTLDALPTVGNLLVFINIQHDTDASNDVGEASSVGIGTDVLSLVYSYYDALTSISIQVFAGRVADGTDDEVTWSNNAGGAEWFDHFALEYSDIEDFSVAETLEITAYGAWATASIEPNTADAHFLSICVASLVISSKLIGDTTIDAPFTFAAQSTISTGKYAKIYDYSPGDTDPVNSTGSMTPGNDAPNHTAAVALLMFDAAPPPSDIEGSTGITFGGSGLLTAPGIVRASGGYPIKPLATLTAKVADWTTAKIKGDPAVDNLLTVVGGSQLGISGSYSGAAYVLGPELDLVGPPLKLGVQKGDRILLNNPAGPNHLSTLTVDDPATLTILETIDSPDATEYEFEVLRRR